jgi:hypothetical protein
MCRGTQDRDVRKDPYMSNGSKTVEKGTLRDTESRSSRRAKR